MSDDLKVIYADAQLLVLDKPAGLLAVPGRGEDKQDCLSARAQSVYPDALIVHRLDMATSGLMVMARNASAQRRMCQAFEARQVNKRYVAVVHGHLASAGDEWQMIDLPIRVDWPRRPLRMVDQLEGQSSQTKFRIISQDDQAGTTRVTLEPVTGRTHQLRVHLLALGHPILGDSLYANPEVQALSARMLLHASSLEIAHPTNGELLHFESPIPF